MDKSLMEIKNKLCNELADMVKRRDITVSDLEVIYKAVKSIYYLTTIEAMGEYSKDGYNSSYNMRNSYSRDGRDGDSDGRYSEGYNRRMESYGYSGHDSKEHMIHEMKRMMQQLDPREKQLVQDCINRMES